jgi:hypothetical protein
MKNKLIVLLLTVAQILPGQDTEKKWKIGGAAGLDLAQMIFVNPKFGAGEDKIGVGGNLSFFAKYKNGRIAWDNNAGLIFGIQRLGTLRKVIPFQKSVDELRIRSNFSYGISKKSPFGYSVDLLFLSQVTPTYEGNLLSPADGNSTIPLAQFFSPATLTVSPGITFKKPTKFGVFSAMLSPASLKMIIVGSDTIARQGLHGNPYMLGGTIEAFQADWGLAPDGTLADNSGFYAKNYLQFGATLNASSAHKFFKYKEGDKEKHRLVLGTSLRLYSNYLRQPQHIDVEWINNVDLFIFKGLSLSLMTNLFWDYDVFVQVDADGDVNTGPNGYESKERRVSFLQSLLIKYNFLF